MIRCHAFRIAASGCGAVPAVSLRLWRMWLCRLMPIAFRTHRVVPASLRTRPGLNWACRFASMFCRSTINCDSAARKRDRCAGVSLLKSRKNAVSSSCVGTPPITNPVARKAEHQDGPETPRCSNRPRLCSSRAGPTGNPQPPTNPPALHDPLHSPMNTQHRLHLTTRPSPQTRPQQHHRLQHPCPPPCIRVYTLRIESHP